MGHTALTKFQALVRGCMVGLAINMSVLPMALAEQSAPIDPGATSTSPQHGTPEKLQSLIHRSLNTLRESLWESNGAELNAECPECGLSSVFEAQDAVFSSIFGRTAEAHEIAFSLDRSVVANGFAELSASPSEQASIVALSSGMVIDFESGAVPAHFPPDLAAVCARFSSIAFFTAAVQSGENTIVVHGAEIAWRDASGDIRCMFAPFGLANPETPSPIDGASWGEWRCAIAALILVAGLTACVTCWTLCLTSGTGCLCIQAACCAFIVGIPLTLDMCRPGFLSPQDLTLAYGIAAVACGVGPRVPVP
jgi:hypothetical protein